MSKVTKALMSCALVTAIFDDVYAVQSTMPIPEVQAMDRFGVDLTTGQVVQRVNTVAIGGDLGLKHWIRVQANEFDRFDGYFDGYAAGGRYFSATGNAPGIIEEDSDGVPRVKRTDTGNSVFVLRYFNSVSSQEFALYKNGYVSRYVDFLGEGGYTFRPLGDSRHKLELRGSGSNRYFVWTTPDGTETHYVRDDNLYSSAPEIIYPNGFKIKVGDRSVVTNTGYALKYVFGSGDMETFANEIIAVNLAYENNCVLESESNCDGSGWPTASFIWPTGAPNVFFTPHLPNNPTFKVIDQHGGETEFGYRVYNACMTNTNDPDSVSQECVSENGQERWSPRLVSVKSASSDVIDRTFHYQNQGRMFAIGNALGVQTFWRIGSTSGRITTATHIDDTGVYNNPEQSPIGPYAHGHQSYGGDIWADMSAVYPGVRLQVRSLTQGTFKYEENARNFLKSHSPVSGPMATYTYDDRGNLEKITQVNVAAQTSLVIQEANYPTTCTNQKTCNKPTWMKDAKGHQTDFTYHAESGQVATVTGPAVNGVRPKTTYVYDEYEAYFYQDGAIAASGEPIWLLKQEWYCRTSNASGDSCAAGPLDKVTKNYYYGPQQAGTPNNLHLRGESVVAEGSNGQLETRVSCFEYDKFGNRIGETLPKGNSSLEACQ